MSDLQCPARILLVRRPPDPLLAAHLGSERVVATYAAPVDLVGVADRHRGESVLIVGEHGHGAADVVLVEIDADGWRVTPWDIGHG